MAAIDIDGLKKIIIGSFVKVFAEKWKDVRIFAESESVKFLSNIAEVAAMKASGDISEEQARALLRLHERSMKMVLCAVEGISLVLVERAVNEMIRAIRDMVNKAIGWDIFQ